MTAASPRHPVQPSMGWYALSLVFVVGLIWLVALKDELVPYLGPHGKAFSFWYLANVGLATGVLGSCALGMRRESPTLARWVLWLWLGYVFGATVAQFMKP